MKKILLIISVFLFFFYFLINYTIQIPLLISIKKIFPEEQKILIKKTIFPHKYINELENDIIQLENEINKYIKYYIKPYENDIRIKNSLEDLNYKKKHEKILKYKKLKLVTYQNNKTFVSGVWHLIPGSAYLDFYDNHLFLISSIGILGYGRINDEEIILKQIKNNIEEFININQFKKKNAFSIKDLKIFNNKIYVSYTKELEDDCWNTSVIFTDLNYKELIFKELFSPKECVNAINNIDKEFDAQSSGGRIIDFDQNHILLSVGDYKSRYRAQKKDSVFGKIIKIDINTGQSELLSLGHRNPQGLLFDNQNNLILVTEHGPQGGDEINLIEINKENTPNYGWAIASYGEHYGGKFKKNFEKYKKYPLLKSHKNNGFIEPIKYFADSIGISEITGLSSNKSYAVSSLEDYSLYFFNLDINNQIQNLERVEIGASIRDLIFYNNKLILFLEDTASIGIINLQ